MFFLLPETKTVLVELVHKMSTFFWFLVQLARWFIWSPISSWMTKDVIWPILMLTELPVLPEVSKDSHGEDPSSNVGDCEQD